MCVETTLIKVVGKLLRKKSRKMKKLVNSMSQQQSKGGAVRGPISEKNFFQIFLTSNPLGVILCGESIARIPEP
jgi:hypothetical protein